jgi:phage terminase small subunit
MRDLTPQQTEFVVHYTSTPEAIGNAAEAARRAGYSEASAREIGRQLLDKPHVRAAVDEANRRAVSGRLTTKAVALLERVIEDEAAPLKTRVDAAKAVLDRAGWTAGRTGPELPMPAYGMPAEEGEDGPADPEKALADLFAAFGLAPDGKAGAVDEEAARLVLAEATQALAFRRH